MPTKASFPFFFHTRLQYKTGFVRCLPPRALNPQGMAAGEMTLAPDPAAGASMMEGSLGRSRSRRQLDPTMATQADPLLEHSHSGGSEVELQRTYYDPDGAPIAHMEMRKTTAEPLERLVVLNEHRLAPFWT